LDRLARGKPLPGSLFAGCYATVPLAEGSFWRSQARGAGVKRLAQAGRNLPLLAFLTFSIRDGLINFASKVFVGMAQDRPKKQAT
jgi:hypothetical protein